MTQVKSVERSASQADSAGSIPVIGSTKNTLPQGNSHNPAAAGTGTVPRVAPYPLPLDPSANRTNRPKSADAESLAHGKRRRQGGGSIFIRARDGLWVGRLEQPKGSRRERQRQQVASARYCDLLKKFRLLRIGAEAPLLPATSPRSNASRARVKATHTRIEWALLYLESRGLCFYCGEHANPPERDHKVPFGRGGSDGIDNIVVSCMGCNRAKGTKTADEFLAARGQR